MFRKSIHHRLMVNLTEEKTLAATKRADHCFSKRGVC